MSIRPAARIVGVAPEPPDGGPTAYGFSSEQPPLGPYFRAEYVGRNAKALAGGAPVLADVGPLGPWVHRLLGPLLEKKAVCQD